MWSRLPVGSSPMSSTGSFAKARAMENRCCWPPESRSGVDVAWSEVVKSLQQRHGLGTSVLRTVNAGKVHRHHDVFQDGQRGHELEELENDADVAGAPACELALACSRDIHAVHDDHAARRTVNGCDHVQNRGLTAARGSHLGYEIPSFNLQVYPL